MKSSRPKRPASSKAKKPGAAPVKIPVFKAIRAEQPVRVV